MARFELMEEWEWPKSADQRLVIKPFEIRCRWPTGEQNTLVWSVPFSEMWGSLVFFRPLQSAHDKPHNYVSLVRRMPRGQILEDLHLVPRYDLLRHLDRAQLEAMLSDFQLHPVRFFQCSFQQHTKRAFIEEKQGWWSHNFMNDSRFRWPFPTEPTSGMTSSTASGAWIFEFLQAQMKAAHEGGKPVTRSLFPWPQIESMSATALAADPGAEVRFAYLWDLAFEGIEHHEALQASGLWPAEILDWLRLIVRAEGEWKRGIYWYPCVAAESMVLRYRSPKQQHLVIPALFTQRMQCWSNLLRREFPLQDITDNPLPLCLLDKYVAYYGIQLSLSGGEFSAHERLEAALQLREWVQGKATPEEMAVLFPGG